MEPLVFYSLLGPSALHAEQLLRSVASLRRWNRTIAVRAYLFGDVSGSLDVALQQLGVDVCRSPADDRMGGANHPTLHKWFSLGLIGKRFGGDVLYLDCDTVLFGDVAELFEKYKEHDWYAREEAWGVDEAAWERTSQTYTGRFVPPFNTGVCLIRRALRHAMSRRLPELLDFHARLEAARTDGPVRATTSAPITSPTTNTWIHEEVALWLALGRCHGMTMGHFRPEHVIHSMEFIDVDPAIHVPIVCHHFNNHREAFDVWMHHHARALNKGPAVSDAAALPALDEVPSYLEIGLWDSIEPNGLGTARHLNPTLRLWADSVTFTDPNTGIDRVFGLGSELRDVLEALASDPRALDAIPGALRERLTAVGVLEHPRDAARRRRTWQKSIATARRRFLRDGVAELPPLLSPVHLAWLRRRYRHLVREAQLEYGDEQCPTRWIAHNEPAARTIQSLLTGIVSDVAGEQVKPSYLYLGCYEAGSVLPEHVDREQCEFSITMLIDYLPEIDEASPWPIYVRLANKPVAVRQRLGDALLYRGRRVPHFRERLPDGHMSTSLFFHFVEKDFTGKLD